MDSKPKYKRREYPSKLNKIKEKHFKNTVLDNKTLISTKQYVSLTAKEKKLVENKTLNLRAKGITKVDVLRKVLLNLDDEDLLYFLGFELDCKELFKDK